MKVETKWKVFFVLVTVGLFVWGITLGLRFAPDNLQPTPPTQIAFTRCDLDDTVWIMREDLTDATVSQVDSCYRIRIRGAIEKYGEYYIYVKEHPIQIELLEQGE